MIGHRLEVAMEGHRDATMNYLESVRFFIPDLVEHDSIGVDYEDNVFVISSIEGELVHYHCISDPHTTHTLHYCTLCDDYKPHELILDCTTDEGIPLCQ